MKLEELIAARLAGMGYEKLAKLSGLSEAGVWRLLQGKVPGRGQKGSSRADAASKTAPKRIRTRRPILGPPSNRPPKPTSAIPGLRTVVAAGRAHPFVLALYRLIGRSALMGSEEFDGEKATLKETFGVGSGNGHAVITDPEYLASLEARDVALEAEYYEVPRAKRTPLSKWLKEKGR